MSEIILELSLRRSSGVLAGIVASLAQAGIELKTQKLQRATEGQGGWLTITGEGEPPEPVVLAQRLAGTRGVEKLMRMVVNGEAVLAEGKPLEDQIQPDDLAELSAGSEFAAEIGPADADADADAEIFEDPASTPDESRPAAMPASIPEESNAPADAEPAPPIDATAPAEALSLPDDRYRETADRDLADALGNEAEAEAASDQPPMPEFAADPTAEDDLAEALQSNETGPAPEEAGMNDADGHGTDRVGATLRRRRRRRR